jgi:hypothetical protein
MTSWLSIHQDMNGIRKFYREAVQRLPPGGWVINLDHVAAGGDLWQRRLQSARVAAAGQGLTALIEGPPVHHPEFLTPALEDHLQALKQAGIDDAQVVWRRFDTVLIMARKK